MKSEKLGELITKATAVIGMTVKLAFPKQHYLIGSGNPAIGTKWECSGVITEISDDDDDNTIIVEWKNGNENEYENNTLIELLSCRKEPDMGRMTSIW